ncbi:hypothetical protein DPEC_G00247050 [Dallia pectoralis]|uniref:Uncharacterized protein n=1 Tax=Dallia pectoralis TaxID=75939 RepID=A0ACC2FWF4_DALPE|nr:hypothetical protein DPEC_G00247050 [Dallia pectoralis]
MPLLSFGPCVAPLRLAWRHLFGLFVTDTIVPLSSSIDALSATVEAQGGRLKDVELGLSEYSDRLVRLEDTVSHLAKDKSRLRDMLDDLEFRSRRNNVRILNVPEKMEQDDALTFVSSLLLEVLGPSGVLSSAPKLDRAHRLGRLHDDPTNARPRPLICCLQLYDRKVRFSLRHPARLHVEHSGEQLVFDSAGEDLGDLYKCSPATVRFVSWNTKSMSTPVKRSKVFSHLKALNADVFFLQETHLRIREHSRLHNPSLLVDANKKTGGACCACDASNEEFSITASSLAISDEPEPDLLEHQHQHDKKTENNSPAGVTDTCPSAPPPAQSPTPCENETEAGASEATEGGKEPR